ncbi:Nitrogenase (molybdenum-iron)-specific transcriptional regulator NifA [hydrothermal vent metagenome]|uniref:Nitrogenase (Molybdenum-iron)-specific transcriptional regulator NifA n=1 Tax=hydrothermal vent metagenome TaxID=652676 RepID=A0A3B1CDR0_9ZZZZ
MSQETNYLDFLVQTEKMLRSTGNSLSKINMVLLMLLDYFRTGIRNPVLLVRDNVNNRYNIELAPELTQDERTKANESLASITSKYPRRFAYEQVLFAKEAKSVPITLPEDLIDNEMAFVSIPLGGQEKSSQTGILIAYISADNRLAEHVKLLKALAGYLGFFLNSTTPVSSRIYEEPLQDTFPMVVEGIVGESPAIKQVGEIIKTVASSRASVFIRGESGTGKELIAKNIHNCSLRSRAPFISLNCAAVSENLLLNELFGHEKGAFTGATAVTKGRFEVANGGTLFLDEIGEVSLNFQAKLLRVLQEGEFERLGSNKTIKVDVRIVCATNADIESLVRKRMFREDLYYRLNVLPIWAPSLVDRQEDIPLLARYFLMKLNEEYGKTIVIMDDQLHLLQELNWPGNVRELENFMHRAFLMENNGLINIEGALKTMRPIGTVNPPSSGKAALPKPNKLERTKPKIEVEEKLAIESALSESKGIQVKAAQILGISLRQLRYRITKYDIAVRRIRA